jgi:hypothetical protein
LAASVALVGVGLGACAGSATPQLIGSYPRQPIATYAPPGPVLLVNEVSLTIEVRDAAAAAGTAASLAENQGGYVTAWQSWYAGSALHHSLTLAVPPARFDSVHQALIDLGSLAAEQGSTRTAPAGPGAGPAFAILTVHFVPVEPAGRLPRLPGTGWNPVHTFQHAFAVFASIFAAIADITIWLVVVAGPFVLIGLGLRALLRRQAR